MSTPESAVLSAAAMDGGDGGFPVLFGSNPFGSSKMTLSFDEDQIVDLERNHTTEQVAYIVFGQNAPSIVENNSYTQSFHKRRIRYKNRVYSLNAFPNPAKDWVKIDANLPSNESAHIIVSDLKGRIVFEQSKVEVSGNQLEVEMDVSHLQNGIYFVTILSGEERISKRLLKVN